jgi:hypothetical protein
LLVVGCWLCVDSTGHISYMIEILKLCFGYNVFLHSLIIVDSFKNKLLFNIFRL